MAYFLHRFSISIIPPSNHCKFFSTNKCALWSRPRPWISSMGRITSSSPMDQLSPLRLHSRWRRSLFACYGAAAATTFKRPIKLNDLSAEELFTLFLYALLFCLDRPVGRWKRWSPQVYEQQQSAISGWMENGRCEGSSYYDEVCVVVCGWNCCRTAFRRFDCGQWQENEDGHLWEKSYSCYQILWYLKTGGFSPISIFKSNY